MGKNKGLSTKWRWIIGGLSVILMFFLIFLFILRPIVIHTAESMVFEQSQGAYSLSISNSKISLDQIGIRLEGISLSANSDYFTNHPRATFSEINIAEIELGLGKIVELISSKRVVIERLEIINPSIRYFLRGGENPELEGRSVIPSDSSIIEGIAIRELSIRNGQFDLYRIWKDTIKVAHSNNFNLQLGGLRIAQAIPGLIAHDAMLFDLKETYAFDYDRFLKFEFQSLNINTKKNVLSAHHIHVNPTVDRERYAAMLQTPTDAPEVYCKHLEVSDISFSDLMISRDLIARRIAMDSVDILLYRSASQREYEGQSYPLPNEWLQSFKYRVAVDSLEMEHVNMLVQEEALGSSSLSLLRLSKGSLIATNITNDTSITSENPKLFATVKATISGSGSLLVKGELSLTHPKHAFNVKGDVRNLDLRRLNSFFGPLAGVRFDRGLLKRYEFRIDGDNSYARGKSRLNADNISIQVSTFQGTKTDRERLLRKLAIVSENPNRGQRALFNPDVRKGRISYKRNPQKTFVNYIFQSSLTGMLSALGIPNYEDRRTIRYQVNK